MRLIPFLIRSGLLSYKRALDLYPPFRFMGVRLRRLDAEARVLEAELPLRWYAKNMHGTMFGGFICATADPLPALLCGKIFPGTQMWSKSVTVDFKRPGRSRLYLRIEVSEEAVIRIRQSLETTGKASETFSFDFKDAEGIVIASVRNTVSLHQESRLSQKPANARIKGN